MKRKKVEAWAVVEFVTDKPVATHYVGSQWWRVGKEENAYRHVNPGMDLRLVRLVPFNGDAERVVRAAVKLVKERFETSGDALVAAVEKYQRKGRKP